MKKIFIPLLTLLLFYGTIAAQSIVLIYDGEPVESDTLEVTLSPNEYDVNVNFDIQNSSDNDFALMVRKEVIRLSDGATLNFCFGGGCYTGDISPSPSPCTIAAGTTLSHRDVNGFHLQYSNAPGVTEAKFTFFNEEDVTDKKELTVILTTSVGIAQISNSSSAFKAYPNPATEKVTIEYNLPNQPTALVLKNMMGATVLEKPLFHKAAKVDFNLSEIPAGIYFYSIENGGETILTKKLIVK